MATRDLLLMIGFLRGGQMFPTAVPFKNVPANRSLKIIHDGIAEQERALFGKPSGPIDESDLKRRAAVATWTGAALPLGTRVGEVADPGVVLCLLYDGPVAESALPPDVFAQTLRRFALRDPALRGKFDEHIEAAGTYVPAWLSPETRRQRSQDAFDTAMRAAREHGFAHAAPLFEGVRGDRFAEAQVALAVYESRDLGDLEAAKRRLGEVVKVAPRNVAARMQRARLFAADVGRRIDAGTDYLAVLREIARPDTADPSREVRQAATEGLWALCREYEDRAELDRVLGIAKREPAQGFEALSRYVHTHPCAWEAQTHLATLALGERKFELTIKLLAFVRWLYPEDPGPHFVYGQALGSTGQQEAARRALEYALRLAPADAEIRRWLDFAHKGPASEGEAVSVAQHVARTLLVLVGLVRRGQVHASATVLHKLPGDVSLGFVLQVVATQEQRRFASGAAVGTETGLDVEGIKERVDLTAFAGEPLYPEQTVGDVPDPGIVVAILYDTLKRDADGWPIHDPPAELCREHVLRVASTDSELHQKLERHFASADASVRARLEP